MTNYAYFVGSIEPEKRTNMIQTLQEALGVFGRIAASSGLVWVVSNIARAIFSDLFYPATATASFFASAASIAGPIALVAAVAVALIIIPCAILAAEKQP